MYVYYRARDMFVKLSLMCLVFTADVTVRAGKGPGGSADGFYVSCIYC